MTGDPLLPLLLAQATVFAGNWVIGAPAGFIHPAARPRPYLRSLALLQLALQLLALTAAVLGFGALAWALWAAGFGYSLAQDVNAVVKRVRHTRTIRRFRAQGS